MRIALVRKMQSNQKTVSVRSGFTTLYCRRAD